MRGAGAVEHGAPCRWDSDERRALTRAAEREARRRDLTMRSADAQDAASGASAEVAAPVYLKFMPGVLTSNLDVSPSDRDLAFCDKKLGEVSRSFAAVIRQLPRDMAIDILVFYLVLRALDTIEDDMQAFADCPEKKCAHLRAFGRKYLGDGKWRPGKIICWMCIMPGN